ncbi:MAG: deoxyhypusine synthase family protein, partial [Candidatus Rokuibacteriota bacterium]
MGAIREFMDRNFRHFNARETVAAARAYEAHLDAGGEMLVTLAGAMSTAELGITLARMIRAGKVHAISCTGANLEEDVFNLVAHGEYETLPHWRGLSADMERDLYERGMNRVTDTAIPEDVMRELEHRMIERWSRACTEGVRKTEPEFMMELLASGDLAHAYQADPEDSWIVAATRAGIPVFAPGWE